MSRRSSVYTATQHRAYLEAQRAKGFGPSKSLTGAAFFFSFMKRRAELHSKSTTLPYVRIKPKASRSKINRTSRERSFRGKIESGRNKYIPAIFGEDIVDGKLFAVDLDGTDLILGFWFCFGEIEEFVKIYLNDATVPAGITVEEHKGTTTQTASTILSNISGYTDTLVLDVNGTDLGVAYVAIRVPRYRLKAFPRISAHIKGLKDIYDPRDASTAYSDNSALCFRNWAKSSIYGPGESTEDDSFKTAANFCDEVPGDEWQASHNYALNDFCTPTAFDGNNSLRIYEVTTDAGSSGASEPSPWDDTLGATTVDGGITWTCRDGRRHVCSMNVGVKADIDSWIETWRTACGCMIHWGESGIEIIPDKARATDHTFLHASGQILESPPPSLQYESPQNCPTVVRVIYTNTTQIPWRDEEIRVAASGVDAGTVGERLCVLHCLWIQRRSEAKRVATERLNAASLSDFGFTLPVFGDGLKVVAGDVAEVTHPLILNALQKVRILNASQIAPGYWLLDCYKYDASIYSDTLESEITCSDFQYNTGVKIEWDGQIDGTGKPEDYSDKTSTHTALGATYLDGSENRATDAAVEIKKDLKMQDGVDISFYHSSAYKGGIYAGSGGILINATGGTLTLSPLTNISCAGSVIPQGIGAYNSGAAANPWGRTYTQNITRAHISTGRLYIYDKDTGAVIDNYRYAFT